MNFKPYILISVFVLIRINLSNMSYEYIILFYSLFYDIKIYKYKLNYTFCF